MTEQSPNSQFHASSFLQGANADYIDQLAARYAADPASVDAQWAEFFRALGDSELDAKRAAQGPSWARADWPPTPKDDLTAALTGEWPVAPAKEGKAAAAKIAAKAEEKGVSLTDAQMQRAVLDSLRALMIIRAYRIRGHLAADRAVSRLVEGSARYALEHSLGRWYEVTPPPCGHIRSVLVGSGELALKQRRAGGVTEYLIERR